MSFPYSYSILGLVPGLILTVVVALLVLYTSLLLATKALSMSPDTPKALLNTSSPEGRIGPFDFGTPALAAKSAAFCRSPQLSRTKFPPPPLRLAAGATPGNWSCRARADFPHPTAQRLPGWFRWRRAGANRRLPCALSRTTFTSWGRSRPTAVNGWPSKNCC